MRIAAFGDTHLHNWPSYATINKYGINSRLWDGLYCLDQVSEIIEKRKIDVLLTGGDETHVRRSVPTAVLNGLHDKLVVFAEQVPIFMIPGNHQQITRDGDIHSLHIFRNINNITVLDNPSIYPITIGNETITLAAIPYSENTEQIREFMLTHAPKSPENNIFLGHLGVNGAIIGSDFVYKSMYDVNLADLHPDKFEFGFLSHFHKHQYLAPNFAYIGSTYALNWSEREAKGIMVYDTKIKKSEFIELKSPKFVEVEEKDLNNSNHLDDNFVRVVSTRLWSEDERESTRIQYKARTLEVVKPQAAVNANALVPRINLDSFTSVEDMVQEYVKSNLISKEGLDDEYLISLGRSILEELREGEK